MQTSGVLMFCFENRKQYANTSAKFTNQVLQQAQELLALEYVATKESASSTDTHTKRMQKGRILFAWTILDI